jgi:hypothetical protein
MIKLKIDSTAGIIEVEGDDDFVKEVYKDYKESLTANAKSHAARREPSQVRVDGQQNTSAGAKKKGKPKSQATPEYLHDLEAKLDSGKVKLKDFYGERYPTIGFEQNAIFVYFLEKILKVQNISVDHVFTCYKYLDQKPPSALRQSLIDTNNKKKWLNTSSMTDIKITAKGENVVLYELTENPDEK